MIKDTTLKKRQITWHFVAMYYLVAFAISGLFNSGFLTAYYQALTKGLFIADLTYLPAGFGTLIAALFVLRLDKAHIRSITFLGNAPLRNTAIAIIPLIVFSIVGLDDGDTTYRYSFALSFAAINLVYATMEEIGWRGYVQDALRPLAETYRFVLIGILWWAWHFRFSTAFDFTLFPLICIGGSFLIGKFVEESKSYFTAGGLHCLVILLSYAGGSTNSKMIAGGLTIAIWLGIGKWWLPKTR